MNTREKVVVHITTVHEPYDTRIYHKECLSLYEAGFDVYLIATAEQAIREEGIKIIPLKKRKNRISRMLLSTMEAYRKAKRLQADIYHFHDPELLLTGRLLKNKHNQVIYDVHEDYETSISQKAYLSRPVRKVAAKLYDYLESFLSRGMHLCLAEKYYSEKHPTGKQILNYPKLKKGKSEEKETHTSAEDKLLYTGNVTIDRGAVLHANIVNADPTVAVHVVGKCSRDIADEMLQIADDNKGRLHFTGIDHYVEREDIDRAYRDHRWLAGLALFPHTAHYQKKELTKFFEYMAEGIPIICSNFTMWKKFMEKHQCGIAVDPYDDIEIAGAITYLRENPEVARKMGENGKKAIYKQLNWQHEANSLVLWYEEVLRNSVGNRVKKIYE